MSPRQVPSLEKKRELLESIDASILSLLKKRFQVLKDIKKIKAQNKLKLHDFKRERFLVEKADKALRRSTQKKWILGAYKATLKQSLSFLKSKASS